MKQYTDLIDVKHTPVDEKIPGREKDQVKNRAGGVSFKVDDWTRLRRFLILGSADGTYYAGARELTLENAKIVRKLVEKDAKRVVDTIVEVASQNLAPKPDPAIFALALVSKTADPAGRALAYAAVPKVIHTGAHLFSFIEACEKAGQTTGWGAGMQRAVQRWLDARPVDQLAYQLIKYRQREGWATRDVLRLAHPRPTPLLGWAAGKVKFDPEKVAELPRIIAGFELIQGETDAKKAAGLIRDYLLPREVVPTELLKEQVIWEALLDNMPYTALLRNLGNLAKRNVLVPASVATKRVVDQLTDPERLSRTRVHPMAILLALKQYGAGHSYLGSGTWNVCAPVLDALNDAFYVAFKNVTPTGKRMLIGIDVSGSMHGTGVAGMGNLDATEAAAAMALISLAVEPNCHVITFSTQPFAVNLSAKQRLDDAVRHIQQSGSGGTDCSVPLQWARHEKLPFEAIMVLTDSESWFHSRRYGYQKAHAVQHLQAYRQELGVDTRGINMSMTATGYGWTDPGDAGCLNVVGLDASAPAVVADFIRG